MNKLHTLYTWPDIGNYLNDKLKYHPEFFFLHFLQDQPLCLLERAPFRELSERLRAQCLNPNKVLGLYYKRLGSLCPQM